MTNPTTTPPRDHSASSALAALDEEPATYWEPITFRVGDRVQVHLSAECPSFWCKDHRCATGTVYLTTANLPNPERQRRGYEDGHNILVDLDSHGSGWFAACELVLLPLAPDRADGSQSR